MKLVVILLLLTALTSTAQAVVFCPSRQVAIPLYLMIDRLYSQYGEVPTHLGTSGSEFIAQFTNKKKRTMTIVSITAGQLACVVTSAEDWEYSAAPVEIDPVF